MGRLTEAKGLLANPSVFFDVGGNTGQTVGAFREAFPTVLIFSFEPVPESYEVLERAAAGDTLTRTFRLALSDAVGSLHMAAAGTSSRNRVLQGDLDGVTVETTTGDIFCAEHGIDRISYLKIDTEGHDLAVLRGFRGMLAAGRIDIVEVEAGSNPDNKRHVDLEEFRAFLEPQGYWIASIRNQVREKGRAHLRRCNPIFVNTALGQTDEFATEVLNEGDLYRRAKVREAELARTYQAYADQARDERAAARRTARRMARVIEEARAEQARITREAAEAAEALRQQRYEVRRKRRRQMRAPDGPGSSHCESLPPGRHARQTLSGLGRLNDPIELSRLLSSLRVRLSKALIRQAHRRVVETRRGA